MIRFFRRNIARIKDDHALRSYGAILAAVNVASALHWLRPPALSQILDPAIAPVCWPFMPDCGELRVIEPSVFTIVVWTLLGLSLANAYLFTSTRTIGLAYGSLAVLSIAKLALVLQDFRLTLNHHYMAVWILVPYLFFPGKRRAIKWLIVSMYVWAGLLKLAPGSEWLSGAAFYGRRPLGLPETLIPWACAYVIVLELVLVFGVLSARRIVFLTSFLQLILFHIASFWVVGFFYPVLMFLLLSIFPLTRAWPDPEPGHIAVPIAGRFAGRVRWAAMGLLAAFSGAQMIRLFIPGDSALTGEGRIFALNMFDAPVECRAWLDIDMSGRESTIVPLTAPFLNTRLHCDPIVYLALARHYCRSAGGASDFRLHLESRRMHDEKYMPIIDLATFCASNPSYAVLRHNWWIRLPNE